MLTYFGLPHEESSDQKEKSENEETNPNSTKDRYENMFA